MAQSLPSSILRELPWSFSEPSCQDVETLLSALRECSRSIGHSLDEQELQRQFPGRTLDVTYAYWVRDNGGVWTELSATVQIRRDHNPTYAEVLFLLHQEAAHLLADQDRHFFEGLVLSADPLSDTPRYEMLLGS